MPDLIKIKVILVVIMRRFVVVQLALQLCLHRAVLRFGSKHIAVLAGIGRYAERRYAALDQHRAGRSDVQKKQRDEQNCQRDQKAFLVFRDPLRRFFVSSAARLAALAVTSDARTVPPAFAAAYSF